MAKSTKNNSVKVTFNKKGRSKEGINEEINEVARKAVSNLIEDSFEDVDDEDIEHDPHEEALDTADRDFDEASPEEILSKDVFTDALRLCKLKNDFPIFLIYKNGAYKTTVTYPYSWQLIQQKYGEGHYKVLAKGKISNKFVTSQSQMVDGTESDVKISEPESNQPDPMMWANLLSQQSEKGKAEARDAATAQAQSTAMLMQAMMQSQQQSSQQLQMIMMEMNKQAQAQAQQSQALVMTLMTTLTSKKSDDNGFNAATVFKMVQDASRDSETRTKAWYDLVEKKAEALAEEKAEAMAGNSDEGESTVKTLVKNFVPILTQVMANQNPNVAQQNQRQPTPEEQARLIAARNAKVQNDKINQTIAQGRAEIENAPRPNLGFAEERKAKKPVAFPQATRPEIIKETQIISREDATMEIKLAIFETVKSDIGTALVMRKKADVTAEACLKKLEKAGFLRQTVKESLSLDDYLKFAKDNGVPDLAKTWIEEFYATIQKHGEASSTNGKLPKPARPVIESEKHT